MGHFFPVCACAVRLVCFKREFCAESGSVFIFSLALLVQKLWTVSCGKICSM